MINGRKTVIARLRALCPNSLLEPVAEAAIFERFNRKRNLWVDVDPPLQLVRMILVREQRWTIPRVGEIITTPTLRADGSLLTTPGFDPRSELYLLPGLQLSPIPEHPTEEQAQAALELLTDLFAEFSFKDKQLDRSVALYRLLACAGAWSAADSTGPACPRRHTRDRQELPHRSHRHDRDRPALPGDHRLEERRGNREAYWLCAPERHSNRLARQLHPRPRR